jgi:hypothetical protein
MLTVTLPEPANAMADVHSGVVMFHAFDLCDQNSGECLSGSGFNSSESV